MANVNLVNLRWYSQVLQKIIKCQTPSKKIENNVSSVKLSVFSQNCFRDQNVICKFYKFILKKRRFWKLIVLESSAKNLTLPT